MLALQMQADGLNVLLRDRTVDQRPICRMPHCGILAEREVVRVRANHRIPGTECISPIA